MAARQSNASPLFFTRAKGRSRTVFPQVKETAAMLGLDLLPWQTQVLKVASEQKDGPAMMGKGAVVPRYSDTVCLVPRQMGKTILACVWMTAWATRTPQQRIFYTAQTRQDAAMKLVDDIAPIIIAAGIPIKVGRGAGKESLTFPNGSKIVVASPNKSGVHGQSVDAFCADEIWQMNPDLLSGLVPARTARPASQGLWISTAGTLESRVLLDYQAKGRAGDQDSLAYFEWGLPEGLDIMDPDNWWKCLPALGRTVAPASVAAAMAMLPVHEIERAYANRTVASDQPVVPQDWWDDTLQPNVDRPREMTLAVDVNLGPSSVSIGASWHIDGVPHLELLDYRPGQAVSWLPGRLVELMRRYRILKVCIDPGGPAGAVATEVKALCERMGVQYRTMQPREVASGCGQVYDLLGNRAITHGPAEELDAAVLGARRKDFTDQWVWSRRTSVSDISPLNAVTLALFGATEEKQRPRPAIF